jgi:hypothetical protein
MLWLWGVGEDGPRIESGVTCWGRGDRGVKVSASKDSKIQICSGCIPEANFAETLISRVLLEY